ncbi:sodium-dependent phosphate transporter 2-like [Bradysia coprophila]|uniref:sodium-dependent phosphate transporter 2-like n=1 Tax=Bradysia coprophila TaxID=38358 RepID=UPI00187D79BC|nr:sodium-dependent phosphate transporter 2-like [Bradysia coprophila]
MDPYLAEVLWIVVLGFLVAFVVAFGVGANDVANSFATSVGSGVLTFRQACYLASVFECAGAILIGYKVSDTIRKGILDVSVFDGDERTLMLGMLAALIGSASWLLVATYFKLPVSATHSVVGATVGFGLVAKGANGLQYMQLITIVASWVVSPLLSGLITVGLFLLIHYFILKANNPLKAGFVSLPVVYFVVVFINVLSVTFDGSKLLKMDNLELWLIFTIATGAAIIVAIVVQIFIVPWQRKKILASKSTENGFASNTTIVTTVSTKSLECPIPEKSENTEDADNEESVNKLFNFLQILSAVFSSFAHGGNDVSNAIGPLIAIWLIYTEGTTGSETESPIYLLLYGGVGIVLGCWVFGRRVIETVGTNLTKITPTTGFVIENGASATVLLASKLGLPISTTHCKVGSVVFVGWTYNQTRKDKSAQPVNWSLFRNIAVSWIVTIPAAGLISAFFMWIFTYIN